MKKIASYCFFIAFLVCGQSIAQTAAESIININLQEIIEIKVADETVLLPMNQADHYQNGNSVQLNKHLKVTYFPNPDTGFEVRVKASSDLIGLSSSIPVNTIRIEAIGEGTPVSVSNTESGSLLFYSSSSVIMKDYDIKYSIPETETVNYLNRESGEYSTTVTYTVMAH